MVFPIENVHSRYKRHYRVCDNAATCTKGKRKGKGQVIDIALLHDEHLLSSSGALYNLGSGI